MKLIAIELGRAVQLFVPDEIRPLSGLNMPEFIRLIQERYGFAKVPELKEVAQSGAKFQTGRLKSRNKTINISELAVFDDGVVVGSFHTDEAEFVLGDFISWTKKTFDLRDPETQRPRRFESHLVIEFDRSIDAALHVFDPIRAKIARAVEDSYGIKTAIGNHRIDFSVSMRPELEIGRPGLVIERRINYALEANRFYSTAGFRTDVHLELLHDLENAIPKSNSAN
jgi:hypothetical protein